MCSRQGTYCYCMFRKNGGEAEASLCVTVCPVRSSSQKSGPSSWGKGNSILFLTSESSDVVTESEGHSVVSDSLVPHEVYSPWNSPGQNTEAHSLSLLQGIIPSQGSNPGLPHCRQILYQLSYQGCTYSLVCLPCQLQLVMQRPWSLMIRVHFCPPGHGTTEWFQIGKGVHQAIYCHLAYLTYRQSTSSKMLGWMKHKLESRLLGEISITSDMQMWQNKNKTKKQQQKQTNKHKTTR